jgi:hypothetical protein
MTLSTPSRARTATAQPTSSCVPWRFTPGSPILGRQRVHEPRYPADARYMAERVGVARAAATDTEFDASYQRGRWLSTDEALAIAEKLVQSEDA